MPNDLQQVEAFAASHPHPHQGGTWDQKCEQFINNGGAFSQAFTTAELAGSASGPLDPDPATAQAGEIHYWSGGDGHDAFQTERGLLCASSAIAGYLGYISFAAFAKAKPAFKYRGHTYRHGSQTLAGITSTASTGTTTPITDPLEDEMKLIYNLTSGHLALLGGSRGAVDIGKRADQPAGYEPFLAMTTGAAIDMTDTEFNVNVSYWQQTSAGASLVAQPIDIAALAKAVVDLEAARLTS